MADSGRTVRIALPVYVDIKAVTGESGEPPALPGSYTPEDEQQRLGDLAQNARDIGNTLLSAHKGSGQVAGACLVLWSLIVSWQEGAFVDDEEGADWSKIIGSGVSVASGAMAGIEGYHKIRMASLGLPIASLAASSQSSISLGARRGQRALAQVNDSNSRISGGESSDSRNPLTIARGTQVMPPYCWITGRLTSIDVAPA